MNTKKILFSASTLAVAAIIGLTAVNSAFAYQGDYTKEGPNCTAERHEAMEKAFGGNDYTAWENLMQGKGRVTQVVNQDNFAEFAQAHTLVEEGKYAEANAIRKELGLRTSDSQKVGAGFGQGMGHGRMAK